MSLRTKIITLLLTLFTAYALMEHAIQRWVIYPRFLALEREEASRNIERAVQALQRDLDLLIPSVKDWAMWDDSYQFVQDRNEDYMAANLNREALQELAVNVLALYDQRGELIWSGAYDLNTEKPLTLPELIPPQLSADHFLTPRLSTEEGMAGLFQTQEGSFLVVSEPVLNSAGEGPPLGRILMARVLDAEAIARLGAQAQVDLRATPPPAGAQPQTEIQKSGTLSRTGATLVETLATTVGQTTVMDVYGEPALTLVVTTPRKISAQGRETLQFASLSLGLAGGLLLATLLVVLRRSVLDPLSRLTAQVTALGTNDDFSVRLHLARRDEIGVLAREFDRMVENLAEARQRLLEQSYKSGIAEMASGVLHNIGNAITPLGVKLGNLKEVLHQAPVEEVDLAIAELADPATEPRRRSDMQGFVELASQELATLVRRTSQDLDGIQTQVDHVQQILAEQQRFSRAERVIEAVAVLPLIQETIRLLSENVRECLRVEVDPGVQQVGPVRATRVVLQQVISNLLINAAEAVADCRRQQPSGRVRISAAEEMREGVPMVHLRFADNGAGIPAENLPRIFTRGFSTKSRGSGMGLHWSANTVIALGGRMYAESAGPDQGACLHVLLPQAGTRQESLGNAA